MDRRSFIQGALWLAAAPVIVRAQSLMPIKLQPAVLYADGQHCDAAGLEAWFNGKPVEMADGSAVPDVLDQKLFRLDRAVELCRSSRSFYRHLSRSWIDNPADGGPSLVIQAFGHTAADIRITENYFSARRNLLCDDTVILLGSNIVQKARVA